MLRLPPLTLAAAVVAFVACGSPPADPGPLAAFGRVSSAAVRPAAAAAPAGLVPLHGGTVVPAGPHRLEIVPHTDGAVEAYFLDASPPAPGDVQLEVQVPTDRGPQSRRLLWDGDGARFHTLVMGARVVAGPVDVTVVVGEDRYRGAAPTVVVVDVGAPPPEVLVEAEPPVPGRPGVVVTRPAPPAVVVEPPATPTVIVERPAPPSIVVERPAPPAIVVRQPSPPAVVVRRPAPPSIVVERPAPPSVVVHRPARPSVHVHVERPGRRVRVDRRARVRRGRRSVRRARRRPGRVRRADRRDRRGRCRDDDCGDDDDDD